MNSPLIIGHRGDSSRAPENTLAAIRLAMEAGADGVEFDVRLSKDGVPVVIHDETLERVALRDERVDELTAAQLAQADTSVGFAKKHPHLAVAFTNEGVPTLTSVLDLLAPHGGPIYVELKCDDLAFAPLTEAVCGLLADSPLLPRIIIKSFRLAAVADVRHRLPEARTAALFDPSIMNILRRRKYMVAMAREFGAHEISLHKSLARKKLVQLAAQAGMPVTVWTCDRAKWVERCRQLGIGALITNDCRTLLAAREAAN